MDERRTPGWVENGGNPERPLGRGLEDVSHLFLTQSDGPVPIGRSGMGPPPSERVDSRPRMSGVTSLQRVDAISRANLAAILRDRNVGLEEGLTIIDDSVPCPPAGEIDLLALDRANQLTVVDFDVAGDDGLLMRGLGHVDWIVRHLPNVRRMYTGRSINFSAVPRILLVAPRFSETATRVAQSVAFASVECVKCQVVHVNGGFGVLFERLSTL
jgi:hypothetical protein